MNDLFKHSPPMTDAEVEANAAEYRDAADEAFKLHGLRAPQLRADETLPSYRRRLLQNLAPKSGPQFSKIDFSTLPVSAIGPMEATMISKAVADFKAPVGPLRSCTVKDAAGRERIQWYGDCAETWRPFTRQPRAAQFNSGLGKGALAPNAILAVGTFMSDGSMRPAR